MTDLVRAKLKQRNYLYSEISMLYHNIAAKQGISNSIQCILYVLCDNENLVCKVIFINFLVLADKQ